MGKNEKNILRGCSISHLLVEKWCVTNHSKFRGIPQEVFILTLPRLQVGQGALFCKSLSGAQAGGGIGNLGQVLLVVQEPKLLEGQARIDGDR